MRFVRTPVLCIGAGRCRTFVGMESGARGSFGFGLMGALSVSITSIGWAIFETCLWLMCACKSRWERYVRLQPVEPYLVPSCVHMNTVPKPVCSTRDTFSKHLGHCFCSCLPQPRQNTCLQGIYNKK